MLSSDEIILISVIAGALLLIVSNRFAPDLVAIFVLLGLGFSGVVSSEKAVAGFSSPVVMTIIGLFVITHALEATGVVQRIAQYINSVGGGSEVRLIVLFMLAAALLSLVMNNIASGAVLLPAAVRVARLSNVRLSKLLIPLSFGTLVGGMATYLTTANIIMSNLLQENGQQGLGMLDFIPTGSLIVLGGLVFMLLVGRRLLPNRETMTQAVTMVNLYETYQLGERLWELQVKPSSSLAGAPLSESGIGSKLGLTVLAIWRGSRAILAPTPSEVVVPNDYLLVMGRKERVDQLLAWGLAFRPELHHTNNGGHYNIEVSEVIIPPRSGVIGKTLKEIRFRSKYRLTAVALWREGRSYRTDVGDFTLQVGDALLLTGTPEKIRQLAADRDYLVLNLQDDQTSKYSQKAVWSLVITVLVLIFATLDVAPLSEIMLAGAAAVVATGCLNMNEAYRAIEWRVVFLIAGMLPISTAMVDTGLAARAGELMVDSFADSGDFSLLAAFFMLTVLVTQIIGGQVTALVIGPIAITSALQLGVSPQATSVVVAMGCSTAFLTPIAHPVNVLMMGPAGYSFSDFFKVGLGMTLTTFIMLMLGMALFWGIR
ncbi:MAG: SLC13 family permease [Anaerolineae bacterium]|nr:SLC13 family permease [Anaerolineae bacterium]